MTTTPISGKVTKISKPYSSGIDATVLSGVEIEGSDGTKCWVWYIQPSINIVGTVVKAGSSVIGSARTLKNRYKNGIIDHVHVRIHTRNGLKVNPSTVIKWVDEIMKKLINYLGISFVLLFLQSCSSTDEIPSKTDADKETLAGHYIYGHEANSFKPCGQALIYWVLADDETLKLMAEKYSHYALNPYDEVYVEITGEFTDKASDGFAADYDGQIQVTKMRLMKKNTATDCR